MDAKLTQDELQAIKERTEKAAIGEWVYDKSENEVRCGVYLIAKDMEYEADAQFIAASRQDIPKLVAEVERLREALSEISVMFSWNAHVKDARKIAREALE